MNVVAKAIREVTGLTLTQFCDKYLDSELQAFRNRLMKNNLYPNEAFLICLVTQKNPLELFGASALDVFFLNGKDTVTKRVRSLLEAPNAMDKINIMLNDPSGLKIDLGAQKVVKKREPRISNKLEQKEQSFLAAPLRPYDGSDNQKSPVMNAENDFDFVSTNIFKK
jgi:hypothetical protein